MKKRENLIIILLICCSQISIIFLQIYWLQQGYKQAEEAFEAQITNALTNLYRRIDPGDPLHEALAQANALSTEMALKFEEKLKEELLIQQIDTNLTFSLIPYQKQALIPRQLIKAKSATPLDEIYDIQAYPNADYYFTSICQSCFVVLAIDFHKISTYYFLKKIWFWLVSSLIILCIQIGVFIYIFRGLKYQTQLSQWKDDFINHITHELNTPIFSISLALKHLNTIIQPQPDTELFRLLSILDAEKNRLKSNIERSLDITRLESQTLMLHKRAIDLHELLIKMEALFALQRKEQTHAQQLILSAPDSLIYGDYELIFNAIYNIWDNGIKYSNKINPEITISTSPHNEDFLKLNITDNGDGIAPNDQDHIFEKYYRGKHSKPLKGSGLGLSYAKLVIEAHKGWIELNSRIMEGSTFEIYLPKHKS